MNERIFELACKAAESSSWKPGLGNEIVQKYFQSFAELIVRECVERVMTYQLHNNRTEEMVPFIVEDIKEHFGVEE